MVIAIDNQWTSTCRFADIVLPATTQFERNDLYQAPGIIHPWHYRH